MNLLIYLALLESLGLLLSHFFHQVSPLPIYSNLVTSSMLLEISSKDQGMGCIYVVYNVYTLIYSSRCWNIAPNCGYTSRRQKYKSQCLKTELYILIYYIRSIYENQKWAKSPKKFRQLYMEVGAKPIWYLRNLYNSVGQINGVKAQDQKVPNLPPSLSLFEFINLSYLTNWFSN